MKQLLVIALFTLTAACASHGPHDGHHMGQMDSNQPACSGMMCANAKATQDGGMKHDCGMMKDKHKEAGASCGDMNCKSCGKSAEGMSCGDMMSGKGKGEGMACGDMKCAKGEGMACGKMLEKSGHQGMGMGAGMAGMGEKHEISKGEWGKTTYRKMSSLYFSGQPSEETFAKAKADGVTTVINLRTEADMKALKWDEKAAAEKNGLNYVNIPVDSSKPLDPEQMKAIDEAVMKPHMNGEKVWLHCKSGQTTAAWFAHHYLTEHKASSKESIEMAKKLGLEKPAIVSKLKQYLETQEKGGGEKSTEKK